MIETFATAAAFATAGLGAVFLLSGLRGGFVDYTVIGSLWLWVAYEAAKLGGLL